MNSICDLIIHYLTRFGDSSEDSILTYVSHYRLFKVRGRQVFSNGYEKRLFRDAADRGIKDLVRDGSIYVDSCSLTYCLCSAEYPTLRVQP